MEEIKSNSTTGTAHVPQARPHQVERAGEIRVEHGVPVGVGHRVDRDASDQRARVGDHNVQPPEPGDGLLHEAVDSLGLGHLDRERDGLPPEVLHLCDDAASLMGPVGDGDVSTGAGQGERHRAADTDVPTGHDGRLAMQVRHRTVPSTEPSELGDARVGLSGVLFQRRQGLLSKVILAEGSEMAGANRRDLDAPT